MRHPEPAVGRSAVSLIAILTGAALMAYGLTGLVAGGSDFATVSEDAAVAGERWLGIEANGWTNVLFAAVGLLLIIGSPRPRSAKAAAAVGSVALGAAAILGIIDGDDVFGAFAANAATVVVWAVLAVLLNVVACVPDRASRSRARAG